MVLRILNLEEQQNFMIDSKVTTILPPFFQKTSKTSNIGMWKKMTKVLHCTLRFYFGQAYPKLVPKNTLQNGTNFVGFYALKVPFLQIKSPKMKSECTAQVSGLLPLDKHTTCLCLKLLNFLKKRW